MTRSAEPLPPAAADPAAPPPGGMSAGLVGAGILLSRIAGLIRTRVFAHYLGSSIYASAFTAALRMPNVLQNLLGEGTLSASFIPVYAALLEKGEKEAAARLASATFSLLLAVAGGLALAGALAAPLLVHVLTPDFSQEAKEVTAACLRIIFPMTGLLVVSAWALGILNSHRRFFLPYVSSVLWNGAMIATLVALGGRLDGRSLVVALSWGALVGGALQFLVQLPSVLRLQPLRALWDTTAQPIRLVVRNAGPAILGRGVVQISSWTDLILASFLFEGAVAVLGYAQTLYVLPVSLFGMSIAAAELPEMARAGDTRIHAVRQRLDSGLRRVAALVIPSAVAFLVLGDVIVAALYRTGRFGASDTLLVSAVLAAYSLGLVATTSSRLHSSALYAMHDTRTPARVAFVRVLTSTLLGAAFMVLLEPWAITAEGGSALVRSGSGADVRPLGAAGLALGAGLAAWRERALLARETRRRLGAPVEDGPRWARLLLAAVLPALLARALSFALPALAPIPHAVVVLSVFGAGYLLMARLLGVREAAELISIVKRRLR